MHYIARLKTFIEALIVVNAAVVNHRPLVSSNSLYLTGLTVPFGMIPLVKVVDTKSATWEVIIRAL
jgi:hypothetical protein